MFKFKGTTNLHAASTMKRESIIPPVKDPLARVEANVEIDVKPDNWSDFINADGATYLVVKWIKDDGTSQDIVVFKCNVTWEEPQ